MGLPFLIYSNPTINRNNIIVGIYAWNNSSLIIQCENISQLKDLMSMFFINEE